MIKDQLERLNQQVKELTGLYRQAAGRLGVSDNEFWVWYTLLLMDEPHSQQDICHIWSLPKQTVNSVVANLVKKEYVTLTMVPGTHNRKLISLTNSGHAFGEAIMQHIFAAERRSLAKMSADERQSCLALLSKYTSLLRQELDAPTAPAPR